MVTIERELIKEVTAVDVFGEQSKKYQVSSIVMKSWLDLSTRFSLFSGYWVIVSSFNIFQKERNEILHKLQHDNIKPGTTSSNSADQV